MTLSLIFRSLPKSGKLNFAADLSITETEASECGLEVFYEKCMTLIDKLEHIGLCKEEFLILKVKLNNIQGGNQLGKPSTKNKHCEILASCSDRKELHTS